MGYKCRKCGHDGLAKVCESCGNPDTTLVNYCSRCGERLYGGEVACFGCLRGSRERQEREVEMKRVEKRTKIVEPSMKRTTIKKANWSLIATWILLGIIGGSGLMIAGFNLGVGPVGVLFGGGFCVYCQIKAGKVMEK